MTIRRRRLWLVALAVLVLAGGGAWVWTLSTAISTRDAYRITSGMSKQQVEALMGRGPDFGSMSFGNPGIENFQESETWCVCDGYVTVNYDINSEVVDRRIDSEGILLCQFNRLRTKLGF